jgi:hypothetical protein
MHRSIIVLTVLFLPACGDDAGMPTGEGSGSASSSGSGGASSSSSGGPASSSGAMDTSADSTGQPPGTSSGMTTTGEPGESSSETGQPLDGDVLQNDSWTPVDSLVWQSWPGQSDCWASVFAADQTQYPFEIVGAIAAIGNGDGVYAFEVAVWEVDPQGMPTAELGSLTVDIDGATSSLTEVDLTGLGLAPIQNNDEFALVMCHTEHMGAPSIAIDADGTVDASRNWVFQQAMGEWVQSPDFFGIDGDFILRAVIMPQA